MSFPLGNTVIPKDFLLEVSKGNVPGHSLTLQFGHIHIDTPGTAEDVWSQGGDYPFWPHSAQAMEIVSDNINDSAEALIPSGAYAVKVYGLNNNFDIIDEIVQLNGTTPVVLANQYRRIYKMRVISSANVDAGNIGKITCRVVTAGTIAAVIDALGTGKTLMAMYTIPRNYTGYVVGLYANVARADDVEITLKVSEYNKGGITPFIEEEHWKLYQNSIYMLRGFGNPIVHKSDIKIRADAAVGGDIGAGFFVLLVHKSYLPS